MSSQSASSAPAREPKTSPAAPSTLAPLLLALTAWAASMCVVFRAALLSGFDLGMGNRGDAIIEISILEHWRAVFMGLAAWNQPIYFHPYADTLGYNDGYFLSGLIYSFWRIGFDPFLSDTLTAMTFRTLGFAAALWLVRGVLRWRWAPAILIATFFTLSNNTYLQAGHAQINSLALLPLLAGLAVLAVHAEIEGRPIARLFAALAALTLGVWLVSAFYFAWFSIYFVTVFALCWLWKTGNWRPARLLTRVRTHGRTLAVFLAVGAVSAIPFVLAYLPKKLETGGHGFMIAYLVQPIDVVNVGERNTLWGWIAGGVRMIVQAIAEPGSKLERAFVGTEHNSGFPLLLFTLLAFAAWRLIRQRANLLAGAFALALALSWLMTIRIWQVSPWILVYYLFPAASGVRVVLRYQLFLVLPVLLLVGFYYRERLSALWQRRPLLAAGIVALLLIEQINFASPAALSRQAQLTAFDAIPAPPASCSAFYLVTARAGEPRYVDSTLDALYPHNVDAMFLAEKWRLPTLNGYSTFNPPDWNFAAPYAADYNARVRGYAAKHALKGLCRLDMRAPAPWTREGS